MATLVEMAKEMAVARAATTPLSSDEMLADLRRFHSALKSLEQGEDVAAPIKEETASPASAALTIKEAFRKNEVVCLICGKRGYKTLTRHLVAAHQMKPAQYKKEFGIPAKQPLCAKSYSEMRRNVVERQGLADKLAKMRAVRAGKVEQPTAKKSAAPTLQPARKRPGRPRKKVAAEPSQP